MEKIRSYFNAISSVSDSDWELFSAKLHREKLEKNTTLLKKGAVEHYLSFMVKGAIRIYIPGEENDLTFGFRFENEFVASYESFLTREPSEYQIETLSETVLWRVSFNDLEELYKTTEKGNLFGRKMTERIYLVKAKREINLLSKTAKELYLDLFSERPDLLKNIPLKHIASYIGITPQALSRIRRQIT